ncbi:uncharacterized protein [Panulirus ornatus]|uniref:uncharacterized protein n=1 Tax=Panulirus ornatus TaxID=150431 RepID=UPI003A84E3AD
MVPSFPSLPPSHPTYRGVRNTAAINVGHTFNKHTYTGGITYDTTTYPGLKPIRNVGANIGYEYKPNESTSLSAGIEHIRGSGDKSTNFNVRLVHILGKKKRRRDNIPKEEDE